jgi:hypothetical protein
MRNHIMTTAETAQAPWARRWLVWAWSLSPQFMVVLAATIVTVALPSIQQNLHFGNQLDLH